MVYWSGKKNVENTAKFVGYIYLKVGTSMKDNVIPWWMRIRVHVLLFGIAISIYPLFLLSYLSFNTVEQYMQKSILKQNYGRVTVLADEIQEFFVNTEDSLVNISSIDGDVLVGKDETARRRILKTLLHQKSFIEEIKVGDNDLQIIDKLSQTEDTLPDLNSTTLENPVPPNRDLSLSQVSFLNDGRPVMYLTVRIVDPDTADEIGYFQVKLDVKEIVNRFVNHQFEDVENIFLVDQSGNLIGHTDFNRVFHQDDFNQNPAVKSFLNGKKCSSGTEYKNLDRLNVVGSFATVGTLNWGVFMEQTSHEAYKPIHGFALKLLLLALLIMLIIAIISITFGVKLVQPIENLEGQVKKIISTGDLQAEIPIECWDEVGRLVQSFNQLLNLLDQTSENLKGEKELLRTVVDGIGAGMVLLDSERNIIWWNDIFADWFGSDLANLPCEQIIKGEETENAFLENGRVISIKVNGECRHIRQMYSELTPDKNKPNNAAYLLLLEDVTQQVEMEGRMIETDKMAAVGLLASGVAHEINNPLAIVAAYSEDLSDRLKDKEPNLETNEIERCLKIVSEQIMRCKQITDCLLGFARKSKKTNDLVDIGVSGINVLNLLGYRAKQKNIRIESQMEPGLLVSCNENEWQQVVLNIVTNALDASFPGGVIEVKAWRDIEGIHFTVQDHGQGIPEQYVEKIFIPFFTTKPPGQGTGLGLFVSYGIIQKMQGNMIYKTVEGKGTTMKISLPSYKAGA